jgi:hypothetical protein
MGYVKPFEAEHTLAPTSQLESRRAAHAAYADDNDVIYHCIPPIEKTRLGRRLEPISYHPIFCGFRQCDKFFYRGSDCRDYFMRRPVALVIKRQLLAEI